MLNLPEKMSRSRPVLALLLFAASVFGETFSVSLENGVTVEAMVRLERPVPAGRPVVLAEKKGAFSLSLNADGKLDLDYLALCGETVNGRSYPGRCVSLKGGLSIPEGRWTPVALTYDPKNGLIRTWVEGGVDGSLFSVWRDIAPRLGGEVSESVVVNAPKGVSVRDVRVLPYAKDYGTDFPAVVTIVENAYREQSVVVVRPTSDRFPEDCEVSVVNTVRPDIYRENRVEVHGREEVKVDIPKHIYRSVRTELVVRIYEKGRELYRHEGLLENPGMTYPYGWRFIRGAPWRPSPLRTDWWIEEDRSLSFGGKGVFPIVLYGASPSVFEEALAMDFSMVDLVPDMSRSNRERLEGRRPLFAKAAAAGKTVSAELTEEDVPGQGFIFGVRNAERFPAEVLRRKYWWQKDARARPAELPVALMTGDAAKFAAAGAACDVLFFDPADAEARPLRFVRDLTAAAIRETGGSKAVIPVLGRNGGGAVTDGNALRTMAAMAVIGGAGGLAFHPWEGEAGAKTYANLTREFAELAPFLSAPNLADSVMIADGAGRDLFACVKKAKSGRFCVVVASDSTETLTRTLQIPAVAGKRLVAGADGAVAPVELEFDAAGRATVTLPPYSAFFFTEGGAQ